ncbi:MULTISPECIES: fumarylacetoacetate hydrolase family protein [unclassified Paenibacillus]|uniref:fumarylacetoacetate hydrolase family protein n=1 Tax=unclassified Paenibacillus TaxID=185978 RepID=UPI0036457EB7
MKLVTYSINSSPFRLGIRLDENTIVDPQQAYADKLKAGRQERAEEIAEALLPSDPTAFLANGDIAINAAKAALQFASSGSRPAAVYKLEEIKLGPPLLRPNKIICVGLNYKDHIKEMKREFPEFPVIFAKYSTAIAAPYDEFPLSSKLTQKLDYEAELAFVIGKRGKDISQADALDYVAGYTVVNDITARDMQKRTIQWLQGKTLDKSLPMGPYLVTKDEIPDPHCLEISLTVNGELRQKSNTEQLLFNVNQLIEFLSGIMTLEPGDVICTGTPGGVGEARNLFLKNDDVVRVEISEIGAIETKIVEVAKS